MIKQASKMVKSDKWEMSIGSSNLLRHGQEQVFGSSTTWPQSSFGCSFCKRQFRSAQALGGHMNVHRRERAKLASLQDHHHHNPPINNYSKFSSSSSSSSSSSPSASKMCKSSSSHHLLMSHQQHHEKVTKVRKIMTASARAHCGGGGDGDKVRLDLNMGLFRDPKEDLDLDLELRLGYPNY